MSLKIVGGGLLFAVATTSVLTFAIGRSVAPSVPPPPTVAADPPLIEETYREIALGVLRQNAEDAKLVPVEKIIPPAIPHVTVATPRAVEASVVEQKKAESNICTRNKRRKVWVSKYKWRCLK